MPDQDNSKTGVPLPIQFAAIALQRLGNDANPELNKLLPAFAMQMSKAGLDVTEEKLLEAAQKGPAWFKSAENPLFQPPKDRKKTRTYDHIVRDWIAGYQEEPKLDKDEKFYMSGSDPVSLVHKACATGDIEGLKKLHEQYPELHESYLFSDQAGTAIEAGQFQVLKYYIEQMTPRMRKTIGEMLIKDAAKANRLDMVEYLHQNGADIRASNHWGDRDMLLWTAWCNRRYDIMAYCIDNGADKDLLKNEFLALDILDEYRQGVAFWQETLGIKPPENLHRYNPQFFIQDTFTDVLAMLEKEDYDGGPANVLAYNTAALFESEQRVLQYLERWGSEGRRPLHDIIYKIHLRLPNQGNLKDWGDAVIECGPSMAALIDFIDIMPSPLKGADGKSWSVEKTRTEIAKRGYSRKDEHPALAELCGKHMMAERRFDAALDIVKKGPYSEKNIPEITIDGEKFDMAGGKFYRLPANDLRGLVLGEETDCCQSIGGAGSDCAEHGYTSENGGFYVVENDKGRIVGQTWAWRGTGGEMCWDTLENLGQCVSPQQWHAILTETANSLRTDKSHDVTRLTVGWGGDTPFMLRKIFNDAEKPAEPTAYTGYRESYHQLEVCTL